jgi:mutator protein MutT
MNAVFIQPPPDFQPSVTVAGCYLEFEDKILLLKRHPKKPQGYTWGVPGGKIEEGETPEAAVIREVYEEVGVQLNQAELVPIETLYIRGLQNDYTFYRFRKHFIVQPVINLCLKEHVEARWVTIEEGLTLPLIYGGKEALLTYRNSVQQANKG